MGWGGAGGASEETADRRRGADANMDRGRPALAAGRKRKARAKIQTQHFPPA
jgi:hypothetical protein